MGEKEIKNLNEDNIRRDEGTVDIQEIKAVEKELGISLPTAYVDFITKHNGARLHKCDFNYSDPNSNGRKNSDSIAFDDVARIIHSIEIHRESNKWLKERANEGADEKSYTFEEGLVPFGDNGGGDRICFDYRKDRKIENPSIVIWNHDLGLDHRVVFIANNFEEFVNMLYAEEE